jgi:hypothetical protein
LRRGSGSRCSPAAWVAARWCTVITVGDRFLFEVSFVKVRDVNAA